MCSWVMGVFYNTSVDQEFCVLNGMFKTENLPTWKSLPSFAVFDRRISIEEERAFDLLKLRLSLRVFASGHRLFTAENVRCLVMSHPLT